MREVSPARIHRVLLAGGGHSHIEVLRRLAEEPAPALAVTLVSPYAEMLYSGMLPGVIAGHYALDDARIPLAPLAERARAGFLRDHVVALDLYTRAARLASGAIEPFDLLSLDVGSMPAMALPGAMQHAVGVRPFEAFLSAWDALQSDAALGRIRTVAMVGGGAAGVEVLLAMHHKLTQTLGTSAPRLTLVTDQPQVAPTHASGVRTRLGRLLVSRQVVLHRGSAAVGVEAGAVLLADGRRIAADRIFFATTAMAQPWLASSGLAGDAQGFVRADSHLRSISHPFVFASGDCASFEGSPRPRSGVFALRDGAPLAANLVRAARNEPLIRHATQKLGLALITTGSKHAIASRGRWVFDGEWVWRWKDRIDRGFIERHRASAIVPVPAMEADPD